MKRIILHWTAGTNQPNNIEFQHYHFMVNGDGVKIAGMYKPEDNLNCNDGKYAQHTGGGNTGSIGVAMCGMCGFQSVNNVGKYPLKAVQCEATFKLIAELCKEYNIPITPETVLTHYEFGRTHRNTSSYGKIDIIHLTPYPNVKQNEIGDFIRGKVRWYFERLS